MPLSGLDWREFRARLVQAEKVEQQPPISEGSSTAPLAEWAHPLMLPEKGALLLAHPMMFLKSQQYFYLSIILLLDHDENGSYGIILNKPSPNFRIGSLALNVKMPEFEDCLLYFGGDVGDGSIQMIHAVEGIEGSIEVMKGLYAGGIEAARVRVASGSASPSDFRFYAKYAGWGPGQLENEVKAGVWFVAAASPGLVMSTSGEGVSSEEGSFLVTGKEAWHRVLKQMGGEYAAMSSKIKQSEESKKGEME